MAASSLSDSAPWRSGGLDRPLKRALRRGRPVPAQGDEALVLDPIELGLKQSEFAGADALEPVSSFYDELHQFDEIIHGDLLALRVMTLTAVALTGFTLDARPAVQFDNSERGARSHHDARQLSGQCDAKASPDRRHLLARRRVADLSGT
jgi:hypothetical protein